VREETGLPSLSAFQNPQPLYGAYLGCVTVYEDRYLDSKFEGTVLQGSYWFYEYLRMTDGGAPGGSVVYVPEFKKDAFSGGAPIRPGVCLNRRERVDSTTSSSSSSEDGGSSGDGGGGGPG
jgi:hypothetical protein